MNVNGDVNVNEDVNVNIYSLPHLKASITSYYISKQTGVCGSVLNIAPVARHFIGAKANRGVGGRGGRGGEGG